MFSPIHLLPLPKNPDYDDIPLLTERWEKGVGKECHEKVIEMIEQGAGEDFLVWEYQQGKLLSHIMKDEWDLRGIHIWEKEIEFPENDTFEGINFSFAKFWHGKFSNAVFTNTYWAFGRVYNFEFQKCLFHFSDWYGVKFEKVKFTSCSFIEYNSFNNCKFIDCEFSDCFISSNIFNDCSFDANTIVKKLSRESHSIRGAFETKYLAEIYKGIKDSYLAGEVFDQYRNYFYSQKSAETRYIKSGLSKLFGFTHENITGYGVKYLRVFELGLLILLIFSFVYMADGNSVSDALLMSASAFATMGNVPESAPFSYIYVIESFLGISILALLLTVMANVWFSEK